jgi:hypothetical protein
MRSLRILLVSVIFAILFGCVMNIYVEQTVERDGSAKLTEIIDLSPLLSYAESLSKQYAPTIPKPDNTYSPASYASLPSPESKGLSLTPSGLDEFKDIKVGDSEYLSFELMNNGEEIEALSAEVYSDTFIPSYSKRGYISSLAKRESRTISFSGQIANVSPGTHSLTIKITFDRGEEKNITVAKRFDFDVLPTESPESKISEMERGFTEMCTNLTKKDPKVECRYENKKLILSKKIFPDGEYKFKKEEGIFETTYYVTILAVPELTNESMGTGGTSFAIPQKKQYFKDGLPAEMGTAKSMVKMTYTVNMPGEIVSAPLGNVSENKRSVVYDIFELYDKKQNIEITAREENTLVKYGIFGFLLLLAILIIGAVIFKFLLKPKEGI